MWLEKRTELIERPQSIFQRPARTALHLAAHGHDTRRHWTTPLKFATCVRELVAAKADVNCTDEDRKTPLHRASTTGNCDTVTALLTCGADVEASDNCRWTPLHYACQEGALDVAKLLLDAKAPVQRENPPCLTPLAVAVTENQVKIAEFLVSRKADPNLRGKGLASPMMLARQDPDKHADILGLFELGFISHG